MFTNFEADRLCQNITYISTKDFGFRVSLPLSRNCIRLFYMATPCQTIESVGGLTLAPCIASILEGHSIFFTVRTKRTKAFSARGMRMVLVFFSEPVMLQILKLSPLPTVYPIPYLICLSVSVFICL